MSHLLLPKQAERFYDNFGARQDSQHFYEDAALDALVGAIDWTDVHKLFEFGCGTGRFAERILNADLAPGVRYAGCDLSQTMVGLARERLAPFGDRVAILKSGAFVHFSPAGPPFDLIFSTYVLDILPIEQIENVLSECANSLRAGGQLGLVGLTDGNNFASRMTSHLWGAVAHLRPSLLGGCRPIRLLDHLDQNLWDITSHSTITRWTIPSEVLVARRK